jgi:hypothetical protein
MRRGLGILPGLHDLLASRLGRSRSRRPRPREPGIVERIGGRLESRRDPGNGSGFTLAKGIGRMHEDPEREDERESKQLAKRHRKLLVDLRFPPLSSVVPGGA